MADLRSPPSVGRNRPTPAEDRDCGVGQWLMPAGITLIVFLGTVAVLTPTAPEVMGAGTVPASFAGDAAAQPEDLPLTVRDLSATADRLDTATEHLQTMSVAAERGREEALGRARRLRAALRLAQQRYAASATELASILTAARAAESTLVSMQRKDVPRTGSEAEADAGADALRVEAALRSLAVPHTPQQRALRLALRNAQEVLEEVDVAQLRREVVLEMGKAPKAASPAPPTKVFSKQPRVWTLALAQTGLGVSHETVQRLDLSALVSAAARPARKRLGINVEPERLSAYNPSIVPAPQWASDHVGKGKLYVAGVGVAGFHSCALKVDERPAPGSLPESAMASELGWVVLLDRDGSLGSVAASQARLSAVAQGVLNVSGVRATRVTQIAGPSAETASLQSCVLQNPRLFWFNEELWMSWVAAGRSVGVAACKALSWPLAQRTFLTPLKLYKQGDSVAVHGRSESTVQLSVAGISNDCVSETNVNYIVSNGTVYAELQIEPHALCEVDLATGLCSNVVVTTSPELAAAPVELHGAAGFVEVEFPSYHKFAGETLLLGVGHTNRAPEGGQGDGRSWRYSSFLYAFERTPPFRLRAVSSEFCFPVEGEYQGKARGLCPQRYFHQLVFGVQWEGPNLVLSYGERECDAKVHRIPKDVVVAALDPLRATPVDAPPSAVRRAEGRFCRKLARLMWRQ
eukprot:TRINITY_DN39280_c0_g1_i1.p1 TRINITY_DN39280_c0_g1~~TRINITY_DN39280_c0_g1_i1.p1  ORF type:complete len:717 (+),score=246.78 TRINITY_DN39280_c0_g1_i1:76-2151(+)